MYNSFIFKKHS